MLYSWWLPLTNWIETFTVLQSCVVTTILNEIGYVYAKSQIKQPPELTLNWQIGADIIISITQSKKLTLSGAGFHHHDPPPPGSSDRSTPWITWEQKIICHSGPLNLSSYYDTNMTPFGSNDWISLWDTGATHHILQFIDIFTEYQEFSREEIPPINIIGSQVTPQGIGYISIYIKDGSVSTHQETITEVYHFTDYPKLLLSPQKWDIKYGNDTNISKGTRLITMLQHSILQWKISPTPVKFTIHPDHRCRRHP